jgi:hypothetical protein
MVTEQDYQKAVFQLGELAHELEESVNIGAEINYDLYCCKRELRKLKGEKQDAEYYFQLTVGGEK